MFVIAVIIKSAIKSMQNHCPTCRLPNRGQMRFATSCRPGDVERPKLFRLSRLMLRKPAIDPSGGNLVTIADDEVTMLAGGAHLQIEGKLLHIGLVRDHRDNGLRTVTARNQLQIKDRQRVHHSIECALDIHRNHT